MHTGYLPQRPRRDYIWKQKSSLTTIVFVAVGGSRDGTGLQADNLTTIVSTRSVGVGMVQGCVPAASRGRRRREGTEMQLEARPNADVLDSSYMHVCGVMCEYTMRCSYEWPRLCAVADPCVN
jgi:hypothetical protein